VIAVSAEVAGAVGVITTMLETFVFMCGAEPLVIIILVGTLTGPDGASDALLVALTPVLELTLEAEPKADVDEVWLPEG
jgi:hypothetical protein